MRAKKHKLNYFDKFVLWVNYLFCAALLISYLAPIVNPAKVWIIAFFGLAYPPLLLLNLLLVLYWAFRLKIYFAISVIGILIGYPVLLNNIGFRFSQGSSTIPQGTIKVMTYNVHNFKPYGYENDSYTRHEMLKLIDEQHPDIISFQEFFTKKRGHYDILDSMKQIMGSSHYYFKPFRSSANEDLGMAVFSKWPVKGSGMIKLSDRVSDNQCIYVDIKCNGKMLRVYNVHLQSINFGPEDYRYLDTVSQKGKTSIKGSRRLGSKLKQAFIKRSQQVFKLKNHAASCPYPYIINGDFNDTPSSFAVNSMASGIQNAFREAGSGLGRTYNGNFPNYQIDYIMASNEFDIVSYRIIEKKLSDHYPICSQLVLK